MPHCLLFDTEKEEFVDASSWQAESRIDQTVLTYPEIVSRLLTDNDGNVITLAGKNHGGPQFLKIDALFLLDDDEPRLVIWESKLQENVDPRRVIGQVLDYASELAALHPDAFAREIEKRTTDKGWLEKFQALVRRRGLSLSVGDVQAAAREAHRAGRFTLVVCAESLPEDVVRMSRWLTAKMANGNVNMVAVEAGPLAASDWVRAAALLEVVRGTARQESFDEQFTAAVQRLQRVRSAEFLPIEVGQLPDGTVALSGVGDRSRTRQSAAAADISTEKWRAAAEPALNALYDRLEREFPASVADASIAEWRVGSRALLLKLKVGDALIEGLRLFGNRVYFVSEKGLVDLGLGAEARWWRSEVSKFPVADPHARQPVVAESKVVELLEHQELLLAFLKELQRRASSALKMES